VTRVCTDCNQAKPLSDFYIRLERGKPYAKCKLCTNIKNRAWWKRNGEKSSEYRAGWIARDGDRVRAVYREMQRKRRADPHERFVSCVRASIANCIAGRSGGGGLLRKLGYDRHELMGHIEARFQSGMSWDNYGKWHLDHIRPLSSFTIVSTDCPDFKAAWALNNLQPLWAADNLKKGARYDQA
jgi:hypothetical protein